MVTAATPKQSCAEESERPSSDQKGLPHPNLQKKTVVRDGSALGASITDRAETIYHQATALRAFVQQASTNPARLGCSIISVLTGLGGFYSGDVFTGTFAAVCGAKELWNLFGSDTATGLQRLLKDIHADVGMIGTLEEANRESYKTVQGNLELISQGVNTLHSQLSAIKLLNTLGLAAIAEKKGESLELNKQALEAYESAAKGFNAARQQLEKSRGYYDNCGTYFKQIEAIAKDEKSELSLEDKIERLVITALDASQNCSSGKALLDSAAHHLNEALEELKLANELKDRATAVSAQAVQMAADALEAGREKAEYTTECQEQVTATQREMQKIQKRSNQIIRLIAVLKEDVVAAKRLASRKLGLTDAAIGIGAAAVMGPTVGIVYGAATGVSAMYAYRNTPTISWAANKVYCWAMGVQPVEPVPMGDAELIRASYDESSSGYWGYFVKRRASTTVGTLLVNLGNGCVLPFRFNLNERDKIAKEDLLTLFEKMNARVGNGELSPERCLSLLEHLEADIMKRGPHQPAIKGFITPESPAYAIITLLRDTCEKLSVFTGT